MISIFKSIFINFHEDTQNAVQWYWMQGDHVICDKILAATVGFAQVRRQNKIDIAEIQLFFSQISQSTRLKLKIFIFFLWTPVLKYRFSLYIVNLKEVGHNEIL